MVMDGARTIFQDSRIAYKEYKERRRRRGH